MPRDDLAQVRRGTATQWSAANPVLAAGEPGLAVDTRQVKYGDGATAWDDLAPAGPQPRPSFRSGVWYGPDATTPSTQSLTLGRSYYAPLWVPRAVTFDRMAIRTTVAATAAGAVYRCGLRAEDGGAPGDLVTEFGVIPADAVATAEVAVPGGPVVPAGMYWQEIKLEATATAPSCYCMSGGLTCPGASATSSFAAYATGWYAPLAAGALPLAAPSIPVTQVSAFVPRLLLRTV